MSDFSLSLQSITAVCYHGTLTANGRVTGDPVLEMRLLDTSLGQIALMPEPQKKRTWRVRAEIPPTAISDGVQTIIIHDTRSGETLASFALVAGTPLEDDLRADIALLRAELDLLNSAFRRHCNTGKH